MLRSLIISCRLDGNDHYKLKAELLDKIGPWNRVAITDPQIAMYVWDNLSDFLMTVAITKFAVEGNYPSLLAFCACKGEWHGVGREQT